MMIGKLVTAEIGNTGQTQVREVTEEEAAAYYRGELPLMQVIEELDGKKVRVTIRHYYTDENRPRVWVSD